MADMYDITVIGGGIAGLAAAHRAARLAPELNVRVLERESRVGGWIRTEMVHGFVVETGPDSFLATKPRGIGLCKEVGLEEWLQRVDEDTRATFVMRDGALCPLPEGLSGLVPARLGPLFASPLLSYPAKVRVAAEQAVRVRPGTDDESLGSFMRRRFGEEAYGRIIEPLMSGIYGGSGEELSLLATFPQLRALEVQHGSVLRGLKRSSTPATIGRRPSPFVAPVNGMEALPQAVCRALGAAADMGASAESVKRDGDLYEIGVRDGGTIQTRSIILATPAFVTSGLLAGLDHTLSDLHAGIPYGSTATVSLGYSPGQVAAERLGHGSIIPRREGRPVMAVTFSSRKFRHRAPEGALLVRGFIRVSPSDELLAAPDDDLIATVQEELRLTCGIDASPAMARVYRLPRSMPQYTVGHTDRVSAMERRLQTLPGLFLAGAAYRGVGIPDCIASGEVAAAGSVAYLSGAGARSG
jgi:oxygen-dependent protoporphyrinogen oxidase